MPPRKKKEEAKMSKCKFTKSDGKSPGKTPWGVNLRLPVDQVIPADSVVSVRLGVRCDRALLIWPDKSVEDNDLETTLQLSVSSPDTEISIVLANKTNRPVMLQEGTSLVRAALLQDFDFEVE